MKHIFDKAKKPDKQPAKQDYLIFFNIDPDINLDDIVMSSKVVVKHKKEEGGIRKIKRNI